MELKINLLKRGKKAPFGIVFGIICILIGIAFLISNNKVKGTSNLFDWIYAGCLALIGIPHLIEGLGTYSFDRLFGKAYVLVNAESILLKADVWSKKQFVNWSDVKSIDYKLNKFEIKKIDGATMIIDLTEFSYRLVIEIKQAIIGIAEEKNIQINS